MHDLLIVILGIAIFSVPIIVAHRIVVSDEEACARRELQSLRLTGSDSGGTLYALPGVEIVQPKSVSRRSAGSRAA